jgi:D-glycero-D-manno-heptose 1,7-bisphosphate phosphatase
LKNKFKIILQNDIQMNKAVFIDRDGVINNDEGCYYIYKPADFKLNEGIIENICALKMAGFVLVIISNQGGIAKGLYKKEDTELLHNILKERINGLGCQIDEIYFCPHHPDVENCLCRKPNSLLIEKAIARFNIDITQSFFIGDSLRDIEAAKKAGVKGIQVYKNTNISSICKNIIENSNK